MKARPQRRYQFTSRALILLILVLSPPLGYVAKVKYEGSQFRRAHAEVRKRFAVQSNSDSTSVASSVSAVQSLIDRDAYSEVPVINWRGDHHIGPDVAVLISKLRGVRSLRFSGYDMRGKSRPRGRVFWTDSELAQIAKVKSLQSITLDGAYSTTGVEPLLALPLYQLLLPDTQLDANLARRLHLCQTLSSVGFDFENASTETTSCLQTLPRLSHITLRHAPAGKNLYSPMVNCQNLRALMIYDSWLTPEDGKAIAELKLRQVQLVDCNAAPGFFKPFDRKDSVVAIIIARGSSMKSYFSHEPSIVEMEKNFTTPPPNAKVAERSPSLQPSDRPK